MFEVTGMNSQGKNLQHFLLALSDFQLDNMPQRPLLLGLPYRSAAQLLVVCSIFTTISVYTIPHASPTSH